MRIARFDAEAIRASGALFDADIETDPWLLFHGTSGEVGSRIERQGLTPAGNGISRDVIARIVAIYDELHWAGTDAGGFGILKPFSLDHDFYFSGRKPTYLAESSWRAALFATADFAGGESCRALRRALGDLELLLASPATREQRLKHLQREYEHLEGTDLYSDYVRPVDLDWLADHLTLLRPLSIQWNRPLERFNHGVVYAVRLEPSDLPDVEYHHPMGLKLFTALDPDRLIAKVHVPPDWKHFPRSDDRRLNRLTEHGVIGAAISHRNSAPEGDESGGAPT